MELGGVWPSQWMLSEERGLECANEDASDDNQTSWVRRIADRVKRVRMEKFLHRVERVVKGKGFELGAGEGDSQVPWGGPGDLMVSRGVLPA